ncbi:MAG: hypothetical protein Q9191_001386 [Dirinaria sp. TL-2023a]
MTSIGDADIEGLTVEKTVSYSSSGENSEITEHHPLLEPKSKRRKLNECEQSETQHDASSHENSTYPSGTLGPNISVEDSSARPQPETPQEKLKSRRRIHIPKNGELPVDAFYTQPPRRCSSPYRIEEFYWQKPRKSPITNAVSANAPSARRSDLHQTTLSQEKMDTPNSMNAPEQIEAHTGFNSEDDYDDILADLPSDAFSSPGKPANGAADNSPVVPSQCPTISNREPPQRHHALKAPQTNLRQTNLYGQQAQDCQIPTLPARRRNWPLASREEPPTHHELDHESLRTWVYPTNLGTIREYQYGIVTKGLYHNMLVALPTGLGKTFIAATIMLNWFRWTRKSQIVFVAPTRPLVSQQVKACFEVAGIPRSTTVMLTGNTSPGIRAEEWTKKRVFFMTPQTLINDLKTGIADPKRIVLLVVDEAHRATGSYAYVEVVKFLNRFNTSFRVLALTATPGASVESVQAVIDGLGISRIEIRTEESLDIRQYVHPRRIDTVLFDYSDEIVMAMELFSKALQPLLNELNGMNAYWAKDPMTLTPYGCSQASRSWMASDAGKKAHWGTKNKVLTTFSLLASLSHGTELLKFHGIGPFFHKIIAFQEESGKPARQVTESSHFNTMMTRLRAWVSNSDFIGHPKLEYVQRVAMNHFLDAGDGRGAADPSRTRIMIFAHYRDSAEEIARVLKRNEPMIRPHVFVGQANSKGSEGMDQKKQLSIIGDFQRGVYNTLVATSIGEEGLDIGEIDLIICYDASASPIRMLQRMGRTGRKRAGNIVVTLMRGKEESNFLKAKDNYEKMQHEIAAGSRFNFHDERNRRIVPKSIQPVVDKKIVDIPPENTQSELPEPSKKLKAPRRPPKKFHMPDNVRTGFLKASHLDNEGSDDEISVADFPPARRTSSLPISVPALSEVLLSVEQAKELERSYLDVQGDTQQLVHVPSLDVFPHLQRSLRPIGRVTHGQLTKRTVSMLRTMHDCATRMSGRYEKALQPEDRRASNEQAAERTAYARGTFSRHGEKSPFSASSQEIAGAIPSPLVISPRCAAPAQMSVDLLSDEETNLDMEDSTGSETFVGLKARSSASLPPSLALKKRFYASPNQGNDQDSESGEDLPEFGTLMMKSVQSIAKADPPARSSRRKTRRMVV